MVPLSVPLEVQVSGRQGPAHIRGPGLLSCPPAAHIFGQLHELSFHGAGRVPGKLAGVCNHLGDGVSPGPGVHSGEDTPHHGGLLRPALHAPGLGPHGLSYQLQLGLGPEYRRLGFYFRCLGHFPPAGGLCLNEGNFPPRRRKHGLCALLGPFLDALVVLPLSRERK